MKNILISGSTGGIGAHLCSALDDCRIFAISRNPSTDSLVYPCDLKTEIPKLKDCSYSIDWIVHLATSYKTDDDLAMLRHLLEFAREHDVKNFPGTSKEAAVGRHVRSLSLDARILIESVGPEGEDEL